MLSFCNCGLVDWPVLFWTRQSGSHGPRLQHVLCLHKRTRACPLPHKMIPLPRQSISAQPNSSWFEYLCSPKGPLQIYLWAMASHVVVWTSVPGLGPTFCVVFIFKTKTLWLGITFFYRHPPSTTFTSSLGSSWLQQRLFRNHGLFTGVVVVVATAAQ